MDIENILSPIDLHLIHNIDIQYFQHIVEEFHVCSSYGMAKIFCIHRVKITKGLDEIFSKVQPTYLTVGAFPTLYAHLVAVLVAGVMAKYVVPWPAELRAGRVVIMIRALDPNAISQMSVSPFMIESVPRGSWQDNAAETRFLDHACARLVSRLQDKRELPLRTEKNTM